VPCCIGFVFAVVAAIVEKQSRFVRFHAFQSLLLHGAIFVLMCGVVIVQTALGLAGLGLVGLLFNLVLMIVGLGLLAVDVLLMIKANAGEEFELPVVGPMARQWVCFQRGHGGAQPRLPVQVVRWPVRCSFPPR
jgi:uncharacterized membrane protein